MTEYSRYAVYYAPRPGRFAEAAAAWLGRDCETGASVPQPTPEGLGEDLAALTTKPRKYGFHGTIRAPFRPADGQDRASIGAAVADLAARLAPARCGGLEVGNPYGFGVALTPTGDAVEILDLAARVVEATDRLRALLLPEEIARRDAAEQLTPRQRKLYDRWGYPFVMEQLSFQLTLSNRIGPELGRKLEGAVARHFEGLLPQPFVIDDLCLFGEDVTTGEFRVLNRYPLVG
ncbi:DUF1045 domain-containing protein [Falsiroseomonas sp.]|jgi:hypothetical protein|uniref:DUF1045 domain-containing protein n=1 Tax=Falsiroseomonas sp. TaxID=2870721 RepID=UPI0034A3FF74